MFHAFFRYQVIARLSIPSDLGLGLFVGILTRMKHEAGSAQWTSEQFPFAQLLLSPSCPSSSSLARTAWVPQPSLMSDTRSTTSSSSNFKLIIDNALKVYQKRTKTNLLLHPLAAQIQTCTSPSDILAVLQEQLQGLDQSRSSSDRWTKWLDPTIHVILTFSRAVGTVGLVRPNTCIYPRSAHSYLFGRHSHPRR
jgi:hypothetical protein